MMVQWYFDVISPFAYLQQEKIDVLTDRMAIEFRPVLLAALLNHWGQLGPAEIEPKRIFTYRHVNWLASRSRIPMRFPGSHPFNPLPLLRLAILAGNDLRRIRRIFRFVWRDGHLPTDTEAWSELIDVLEIEDAETLIGSQAVKTQLRENGDAAIDDGVFGVPTLVLDGHVIWGLDATEMALEYLDNPDMFATSEMQRIGEIRAAAERRRH